MLYQFFSWIKPILYIFLDFYKNISYYHKNLDQQIKLKFGFLNTNHIGKDFSYRCVLKDGSKTISFWNDVPLKNFYSYNMIVEIPKWTRDKYEISTTENDNPIKQDIDKSGKLRSYKWGDMMFNYGAFPQTWEDNLKKCKYTEKYGDNDPLDVIEIGVKQYKVGSIVPVKILGVIPMIDDNETDWKVIAISSNDVLASRLNNLDDIEKHLPGCINAIKNWLKLYKTAEGKCENTFAFDGLVLDKEFAKIIIEETHHSWKKKYKSDEKL